MQADAAVNAAFPYFDTTSRAHLVIDPSTGARIYAAIPNGQRGVLVEIFGQSVFFTPWKDGLWRSDRGHLAVEMRPPTATSTNTLPARRIDLDPTRPVPSRTIASTMHIGRDAGKSGKPEFDKLWTPYIRFKSLHSSEILYAVIDRRQKKSVTVMYPGKVPSQEIWTPVAPGVWTSNRRGETALVRIPPRSVSQATLIDSSGASSADAVPSAPIRGSGDTFGRRMATAREPNYEQAHNAGNASQPAYGINEAARRNSDEQITRRLSSLDLGGSRPGSPAHQFRRNSAENLAPQRPPSAGSAGPTRMDVTRAPLGGPRHPASTSRGREAQQGDVWWNNNGGSNYRLPPAPSFGMALTPFASLRSRLHRKKSGL